MSKYVIRFHPEFFDDLNKLSRNEVEIFEKKKEKIKQNPLRLEHLSGGGNCYSERITSNVRVIYYVRGNEIWMLIIDKHEPAYKNFRKRLYSLKARYIEGNVE